MVPWQIRAANKYASCSLLRISPTSMQSTSAVNRSYTLLWLNLEVEMQSRPTPLRIGMCFRGRNERPTFNHESPTHETDAWAQHAPTPPSTTTASAGMAAVYISTTRSDNSKESLLLIVVLIVCTVSGIAAHIGAVPESCLVHGRRFRCGGGGRCIVCLPR